MVRAVSLLSLFWVSCLVASAQESSLTPSQESPPSNYRGWVGDLDSNEFVVRQRATQRLLEGGEPAIEAILELAPLGSPEMHSRALAILESWLISDRPKRVRIASEGLERWARSAPTQLARQAEALLEHARAVREARAIERIRELGGRVEPDGETGRIAVKVGSWSGGAEDFASIRDLQSIARVSLEESELDDSALKYLRGRGELKRLYLGGSRITGIGFKELQGLESLTHLSLKNLPVDDARLKSLPDLPSLRGLGLDGTKIGDGALADLKRFPKLETLWLEGTQITDAGLAELQALADLRTLYLANTRATGAGLQALAKAPALRYLSLMGAQLKPETCQYLGQFQQLETLGLDSSTITDEQLSHLAPLTKLRVLWLSKTELTDAAIEPLSKLTGLSKVYLTGSRLSSAGLSRLRQRLPNCDVVFEEPEK
jgi:hypothetical protein